MLSVINIGFILFLEKIFSRGLSLAVGDGCLKSKLDLFFFSFHGIKDMNGQAASSSS